MNTYFRFIALIVLTVAASFSYAADDGNWISTTSGCMVFASGPAAKDVTVSWTGHCSDGYADGKGTLSWSNGNRYEGDLQVGMLNGSGTYYWANGDWYEGEFRKGRREGIGTQYYGCSGHYHGEFHNGVMDGVGVLYMADGNHYEGAFHNGAMENLGVRYFANGNRYEGEFRNNQEEGLGTLFLANHSQYEGEFKDDRPDGRALVTYASGDVYEGTYVNGQVDGRGILTKANGERDVAYFKDNHGAMRVVSNIGPKLYESCHDYCTETSLSCSNTIGAVNPDDPNYQDKMIDSASACGREMALCASACERHNPTVDTYEGIVEVGEIDDTTNTPPAGSAAHDAQTSTNKSPRHFATEQATATNELRTQLDKQHQQLQMLQQRVANLPPAATSTTDCQSPARRRN